MPLFAHPTPSDPGSVLRNIEVTPDIVFVISSTPNLSSPLGYFCSTGGTARTLAWLSFPANTDTWLWFNGPQQLGDGAWPATFYLVRPTDPNWSPPPPPPAGYTSTSYASAGSWTSTASPDVQAPAWLITMSAGGQNVAYVQLVGGRRTWFKSGTVAGGNSWAGAYIDVGPGENVALVRQPPGVPGDALRVALFTTKNA